MAINRIKTGGITDGTIQSGDLAPGTIASDRIAPGTIANDRLANNSITINGTSIALGASGEIVAGTDWQAVTVADGSTTVNTVAGGGYLLDTNAGVIEAFLPTSPNRGDTVVIADYSGTFATNNVIVNTGGINIDSTVGSDFILSTNNAVVELVYVDAAKGWLVKTNSTSSGLTKIAGGSDYGAAFISATGGTITTSGDYKTHVFTGDGCFVVSCAGNPFGSTSVDYLVVAGGGSSGGDNGGGGGAGGFRLSNSYSLPSPTMSPLSNPTGITVSATTYPITVGAGGAGAGPATGATGASGSNSVFSTITSTGGGFGGGNPGPVPDSYPGGTGGSGGGAAGPGARTGAAGNTPPVSPPQGNPGGNTNPSFGGGGGGGAGAAGSPGGTPSPGGPGGIGSYIDDTFIGPTAPSYGTPGPVGSTRYFAGGGGGGVQPGGTAPLQGSGGAGGGAGSGCGANNGTTNTGGGAGSGNPGPVPVASISASGGKGIVIIRYKFQN